MASEQVPVKQLHFNSVSILPPPRYNRLFDFFDPLAGKATVNELAQRAVPTPENRVLPAALAVIFPWRFIF